MLKDSFERLNRGFFLSLVSVKCHVFQQLAASVSYAIHSLTAYSFTNEPLSLCPLSVLPPGHGAMYK